MGHMLIRPADTDDVAGLVSLFEEWGHPLSSVDVLAVLAEWGSTARGEVLVAVVDGEIAGMVAVSAGPRFAGPGRYGHLSGLAVAANHRRRGVGTALLKGAEGSVYAWGCDRLELTSSRSRTAAHNFYRRHGYEETADHHARYVRLFDRDSSSPMTEIAP
jgi:ribosomal protein S18 acetylase RimI-like enzyme